jgi:hypothetical protein
MTAQMEDFFLYRWDYYALVGISEGELLDISELGLRPVACSTACWRGYQAVFALSGSRLVLDELRINLYKGAEGEDDGDDGGDVWMEGMEPVVGPVINDVRPFTPDHDDEFNNHYKGLRYPLAYSGGVLLGKDPAPGVCSDMGFCPEWGYQTLIELVFDAGVLVKEFDRSEQMAAVRPLRMAQMDALLTRLWSGQGSDGRSFDDDLTDFIGGSFDRSYDRAQFGAADLESESKIEALREAIEEAWKRLTSD